MSDWWKSAVIYQIYPRSFQDSDGDGVGDLNGITRRLDHVASLGVDVIWLSPFFTSPMDDMGYDISDHTGVDPMFGTLDDFQALLKKTHALGMKLIIDQVPSHTSDRHPWFQESRQSRDNPKADWYVWAEAKPDGSPPNNWLSVFGGPAWTWEPRRKQYYLHSFLTSQPQMNFHNPDVPDAILDAMRTWLDRGVDGFRLDSINYPYHDEKLRNNPPRKDARDADWVNPYNVQKHVYDKTRPETPAFLERVRALTDEYDGTMTVGEVGEGRGGAKIMGEYTCGNNRLHMAYSFEMLGDAYNPDHFKDCVGGFFKEASGGWPCWAFSNHDVVRHVSRWAKTPGTEDAVARQAIALMISLEGAKCLYQGEELGQTETDLDFSEIVDPPGLKFWPEYKGRDGCRTPMVWEKDAPNAGFTRGDPWLPVKPDQAANAVDREEADKDSVLHHYRAVLAFYKTDEARPLRDDATTFLDLPDPILAFHRGDMTCVFNLSADPHRLTLGTGAELTGPVCAALDDRTLDLPGCGYAWLTSKTDLTLTSKD